jgi:TATA-binding protein-associated factor Taf7
MASIKKVQRSSNTEASKGMTQSDMDRIIQGIKAKYSREIITKMSQEELQNEVINEMENQNQRKKVTIEEDEEAHDRRQ